MIKNLLILSEFSELCELVIGCSDPGIFVEVVVTREGDIEPGEAVIDMHEIVSKDAENSEKIVDYFVASGYHRPTEYTKFYSYSIFSSSLE